MLMDTIGAATIGAATIGLLVPDSSCYMISFEYLIESTTRDMCIW